jgi:putative intracellular protease/amidase
MNEKTTMKHIAYLYILEGMSDWEPGLVIAELNSGRFFKEKGKNMPVKTVGLTKNTVTTMGGLALTPHVALDELNGDEMAVFILPGATSWLEEKQAEVLEKTKTFLENGVLVAAICGATEAMANAGMLNHRPHTSNSLDYLKMRFPESYCGEAYYVQDPAVTDDNLITANFSSPHDFARHILKKLDVFSNEVLEAWYQQFVTHDPKYTFALMQALQSE